MLVWPGGSTKFQKILTKAEQLDATSVDHLARWISMANAALFVANNGFDDLFTLW
jgi:hypothetical protein